MDEATELTCFTWIEGMVQRPMDDGGEAQNDNGEAQNDGGEAQNDSGDGRRNDGTFLVCVCQIA